MLFGLRGIAGALIIIAATGSAVSRASADVVDAISGTYGPNNLPFSGTVTLSPTTDKITAASVNAGALGLFNGLVSQAISGDQLFFSQDNTTGTYQTFFVVNASQLFSGQAVTLIGGPLGSSFEPHGDLPPYAATGTIGPVSAVPGPVVGAGLPGLLAGFGAMLAWYRKKHSIAA
jgi:hypothetical protein